MRSRTERMWWGMAIEAPDPQRLAAFYSRLLDWPVVDSGEAQAIVKPPQPGVFLVFQLAQGYTPPSWPPEAGSQRPMMHFDVEVADLNEAVSEALALGATAASVQPQPNVRVLFDPAGHPFCLVRDDG